MRLEGVINQAASGLESVSRQLAVVGQNVGNANTVGYTRESVAVTSSAAAGLGMGVRTGIATRAMDTALQAELLSAAGQGAGAELRAAALAQVDAASGTPGAAQDLASLVGALRDSFSTLLSEPASQTQQRIVVNRAADAAAGFGAVSGAIQGARQTAQDAMVADVAQANTGLRQLGTLSDSIMMAQVRGESTADLEDRRDTAMRAVAELTGARFLKQSNGDLLAVSGGMILPIRPGGGGGAATGPLTLGPAVMAAGGTAPPLLLGGAPVVLAGGRIGAAAALRDQELPGLQDGLDTLAHDLAAGFAGAGVPLFSDGSGAVPAAAGGFAQRIQVSATAAATPSVVRDGAGAPGATGNTAVIATVLNTVLASGSGTVPGRAATLVAAHAGLSATAAKTAETERGVTDSLGAKLSSATGVSVDTEMTAMVRLQNSYSANAKVLSTVQAIYAQLMEIVR